jgi:hypothetical protein
MSPKLQSAPIPKKRMFHGSRKNLPGVAAAPKGTCNGTIRSLGMDRRQTALFNIGRALQAENYRFTTPTPETHRRVISRFRITEKPSLTDIFGWNTRFDAGDMPAALLAELDRAGAIAPAEYGKLRSTVRFSTIGDLLCVHSGYPTREANAVFFGPDTYRFVRAMGETLARDEGFVPKRVIDIGAGSGAGGLFCASLFPDAHIVLSDINADALRFCEVNRALNGVAHVECIDSDILAGIDGEADLIIANPPYLSDRESRLYRHGGGAWGCDLSRRIVEQALDRLTAGGKLILYTGTPVVGGTDMFMSSLKPLLAQRRSAYRYEEIDPDVFDEELDAPPYDAADRIAVVLLLINARDRTS